jgi:dynamin 1-like protein
MLPDEDDTPMSPIRDPAYEGGFVSHKSASILGFVANQIQPSDPESAPALTEREALETELIRRLISSYFNIVRETVADQVPKAIMHLLVNHSKDVVQNRLVSSLYKEDLFQELLYEDDTIKAEREKCEKLLKTYKEAAKIVGEVL